jgi:predicted enzyme involved in methoxymalonyl-ACP biosynthesis
MVDIALEEGIRKIIGIYVPTPKNKLVADLYPRLGFLPIGPDNGSLRWELEVEKSPDKYMTFIESGTQ